MAHLGFNCIILLNQFNYIPQIEEDVSLVQFLIC